MSGIETLATAAEYVEGGLGSLEAPATDHGKTHPCPRIGSQRKLLAASSG